MKKKYSLTLVAFFILTSFLTAQPVISAFSPVSGSVGTLVTISGTNFDPVIANNIVFFGPTKAAVSSATTTSLTVQVPIGAGCQYISVTDLATHLTGYSSTKFIVTFPCGGSLASSYFAPRIDSVAGTAPRSVLVSDFDGDGKADIAIANTSSNTISVFRNLSMVDSIYLATKINFGTGASPYSIAVGDLDGDGKPDLVSSNYSSNTISVFLNNSTVGNISFSTKVDYATGTTSYDVSIGDIDGDGKPDIAAVNYSSNTVSLFRNTCSIGVNSFSPKIDFATGINPKSICIGDIDGDNIPDLAIADYNANTVSVLKNISTSGAISFNPKVDITTGVNPSSVSIGDLDNDGKADLAVADYSALSVLRNTSTAGVVSFAPKVDFTMSNGTTFVAICDLDGNGKLDLALTNSIFSNISIFKNNSTSGTISLGSYINLPVSSPSFCASLADLDGDGKPDVISANSTSNKISMYRNKIYVGPYMLGVSNSTICNGGNLNISLTASAPSTYTWVAGDNPNTTGESTSIQTSTTLNNSVTNTSGLVQTVTYTITPTSIAAGCLGSSQIYTLTVNPTPKMTSDSTDIIADGGTVYIPFTANIPSSYLWIGTDNINTTGETTSPQTTAILGDVITLTAGTVETVTYTVTPTSTAGCGTGVSQTIGVTINIVPTITSFSPSSGNSGTTVVITGTNFNSTPSNNIVFFGAVKATVIAGSTTSITVAAPIGATNEFISVTDITTGLTAYTSRPFVETFPNCFGIYPLSFDSKVDSSAGNGPRSIVSGDIDGDGKADLIVANVNSACISVFLNTSTGGVISFAPKISFATGSYPFKVAIDDLDGDGKLDLATVNDVNTFSVLRNTSIPGAVSFAPKIDFGSLLNQPRGIALGDLNKDGKPEIVIANSGSSLVSVYANKSTIGNIVFLQRSGLTIGSSNVADVAIGDINGDSKPEIIAADKIGCKIAVFENYSLNGTYTFGSRLEFSSGCGPISIAASDLDGDGKLDVATANSSGTVSVLKNITAGITPAFSPKINYSVGTNPYQISIGDIDGDNKLDIAVANYDAGSISLLNNTSVIGTVSFAGKVDFNTGGNPSSVAIVDLDGNSKPDLSTANPSASTINLLQNKMTTTPVIASISSATIPSGGVITIPFISTSPSTYTWIASDNSFITGESTALQTTDTLSNLLINTSTNSQTVVYSATPTSTIGCGSGPSQTINITVLAEPPSISSFTPLSGPIGTTVTITGINFNPVLNNNIVFFGATQALVSSATTTTLVVTAPIGANYKNISVTNLTSNLTAYSSQPFLVNYVCGDSFTTASLAPRIDLPRGPVSESAYVSVGDIDGDGKSELVVSDWDLGTISIYRNTSDTGTISFSPKIDLFVGGLTSSVEIRDLDGDGKSDLAVTSINVDPANALSIFKNTSTTGNISFDTRIDYRIGNWHENIAIDDLDKDGRPDILISNYLSYGNISIFRNTSSVGNISFAPNVDSIAGDEPFGVAITDLNGDKKPDLMIANKYDTFVSVFENTSPIGAISFAPKVNYPADLHPGHVATGDLDGDGKPDMAVTNFSSNTISLYLNTSTGGAISFAPKVDLTVGASGGNYIAIDDMDGDGKLDIVFNYNTGGLYIMKNMSTAGTFSFGSAIGFGTGPYTVGIAIGDLDGDGKPDIAEGYRNGFAAVSIFRNTQCAMPDTSRVWPGDTDHNLIVDNNDLLPLGLFYGQNGIPRDTISNAWQADSSANWGIGQTSGNDIKHVDCNGDSLINSDDTLAINLNFSSVHAIIPFHSTNERSSDPDLYFVSSGGFYNSGDWVDIEVWTGRALNPVNNLYGIAFNINYDVSLVEPGTESLTYPVSWIGTPGTNTITISKIDPIAETAYGGETRINHSNVIGYGKIADFRFQVSTSYTSTAFLHLSFPSYLANNSIGSLDYFNTIADSIEINPISTGLTLINTTSEITIYPNPFTEQTTISFSEEQRDASIKIMDLLGKEIKTINFSGKQIIIEKGELLKGIYFIQVVDTNNNVINKKIILQ